MSIEFGLALDFGTTHRTLDQQIERYLPLVKLAERYAIRSIWAGESYPTTPGHPGGFHVPSSFLVLAALARETRLTLGTGVSLLPACHPIRLAYDTTMLDQLTGGRLVLGFGLGSAALQRRFGVDPATVGPFADEMLAMLKALWAGEPGFTGRLVRVEGGIGHRPSQPGGPPIWVGGAVRRSVERAARWGDGYYASSSYTLNRIALQVNRYCQALSALGKDPAHATVSVNRLTFVAETEVEAFEMAGRYVGATLGAYARLGGLPSASAAATADGADLVRRLNEQVCLVGTPAQVAGFLRRYQEVGVTHVQLRVSPAEMPVELAARSIELLAQQVLPQFGPAA